MGHGFVDIDVQGGRQWGNVCSIQSGWTSAGCRLRRWIHQG